MQNLIFRGEDIVVHLNEGRSDFLLVTFIGAYHEHEAESKYFFDAYATLHDVTCIGITSRKRNFYLSAEMTAVLELVGPYVARHSTVIVAGQSIGGYAAIKYSSRLGANLVLAFSPAFSIDPDELDFAAVYGNEEVGRRLLKSAVGGHRIDPSVDYTGMGIRAVDCSGLIVSVHDPRHILDDYSIRMISRVHPGLVAIGIGDFGHVTVNIVPSTEGVAKVIGAMLTRDADSIRKTFRRIVRGTPSVRTTMLLRLAPRKPELCVRILASPKLNGRPIQDALRERNIHALIAYALIARGSVAMARAILSERYQMAFPPLGAGVVPDGERFALLLSSHGTFLGYHAERREMIVAADVFSRKDVVPVIATGRDGMAALHVVVGTRRVAVFPSSTRTEGVPDLSYVETGRGTVAIKADETYMRASHDGTLDTGATVVAPWEEFTPLMVASDDALVATSYLSWFQQSLFAIPTAAAARIVAASVPDRKDGTGWLKRLTGRG